MPYLYSPVAPTTSMLYNQSLTAFLNANRSSRIHTLFLSTPQGKLLCSSSPIPAARLRAQATIACSIWTLYKSLTASGAIAAALPPLRSTLDDEDDDDDDDDDESQDPDPDVSSITIQLEDGTMVIRALTCSLVFVIIGPSAANVSASASSLPSLASGLSYLSMASTTSPPPSSHSMVDGEGTAGRRYGESSFSDRNGLVSSAASVAGSVSNTVASSIKVLRKQSEQLAKWLDGELEGLSISSGL